MKPVRLIVLLIGLFGLFAAALPVLAQTGDDYELEWWTVAGGGDTSEEGDYSLTGAIGQPGTETVTDGEFTLVGGFFATEAATGEEGGSVYLPIIIHP
jgi:hypothetical protein